MTEDEREKIVEFWGNLVDTALVCGFIWIVVSLALLITV